MKATANEKLIPQTEEDISEIVWVKKADLKKYLENTFHAIKTVLNEVSFLK